MTALESAESSISGKAEGHGHVEKMQTEVQVGQRTALLEKKGVDPKPGPSGHLEITDPFKKGPDLGGKVKEDPMVKDFKVNSDHAIIMDSPYGELKPLKDGQATKGTAEEKAQEKADQIGKGGKDGKPDANSISPKDVGPGDNQANNRKEGSSQLSDNPRDVVSKPLAPVDGKSKPESSIDPSKEAPKSTFDFTPKPGAGANNDTNVINDKMQHLGNSNSKGSPSDLPPGNEVKDRFNTPGAGPSDGLGGRGADAKSAGSARGDHSHTNTPNGDSVHDGSKSESQQNNKPHDHNANNDLPKPVPGGTVNADKPKY